MEKVRQQNAGSAGGGNNQNDQASGRWTVSVNGLSAIGNAGGGSEDAVGFCGGFELCEVGVGEVKVQTDRMRDESGAPTSENSELELDGVVADELAENQIAGSWFGEWLQAVLDREFGVTIAGGSGIQTKVIDERSEICGALGLEEKRAQECAGTGGGLEEEIKENAAAGYGSAGARVLEGQQEKETAQYSEMLSGAQLVEGCQIKENQLVIKGTATDRESEDVNGGGGGAKSGISDECTADEVTATDEVTAINAVFAVVSLEGSGAVKWQWKFGGDGCGVDFEADGVGGFGAGSKVVVEIAENGGGILFGALSGGGCRTKGVAGCKIEVVVDGGNNHDVAISGGGILFDPGGGGAADLMRSETGIGMVAEVGEVKTEREKADVKADVEVKTVAEVKITNEVKIDAKVKIVNEVKIYAEVKILNEVEVDAKAKKIADMKEALQIVPRVSVQAEGVLVSYVPAFSSRLAELGHSLYILRMVN